VNLHVHQHVDFESPGRIAAWAFDRGQSITGTSSSRDEERAEFCQESDREKIGFNHHEFG
jgi:hypothetical protein